VHGVLEARVLGPVWRVQFEGLEGASRLDQAVRLLFVLQVWRDGLRWTDRSQLTNGSGKLEVV
jgi:hypothetical protein